MIRRVNTLLIFAVGYSLLFVLSVLFIVPRYLPGGVGGFLLGLITDTEPEGRPLRAFLAPLIWVLLPLTSIGLCVMSWVSYGVAARSTAALKRLSELGGILFFAASFFPAILVVRQLLIFHIFGVELPKVVELLTNFVFVFRDVTNPTLLLGRGVWVIPVIIFIETGLFFGFFLPGDSLLLTAGVLGSVGRVDLGLLIPFSILAAFLGDQMGYAIGRRSEDALSRRYRFVHDNVSRASEFYSKHGGKAIVLARFIPVVRTFAPVVAGAARMRYRRFMLFNLTGGTLWVLTITLAGYFIGSHVPKVAQYLNPLILAVIISSPLVWILAWVLGRAKKKSPAKQVS
jgi:membrane-associated protein